MVTRGRTLANKKFTDSDTHEQLYNPIDHDKTWRRILFSFKLAVIIMTNKQKLEQPGQGFLSLSQWLPKESASLYFTTGHRQLTWPTGLFKMCWQLDWTAYSVSAPLLTFEQGQSVVDRRAELCICSFLHLLFVVEKYWEFYVKNEVIEMSTHPSEILQDKRF